MSIIGAHSAVVSLGASCQTARQIRQHGTLLAQRLGEGLEARSFPFDWLFAPPEAVARMLRGGIGAPEVPAELIMAQRPFWARHGIWLWHDPAEGVEEGFAEMHARMTRRWQRFLDLRRLRRRVFVVSNTQNNLHHVPHYAPQAIDFTLSARRMAALVAAVEGIFGAAGTEVMFVSYATRVTPDAARSAHRLALITPDTSNHEGDDAQWGQAFDRLVR